MTSLSRRAFTTAAVASLLAGCGAGQQADDGPATARTGAATGGTTGSETGTGATAGTAPSTKASPPLGRSVPVRLRIPAIEVDTPVMRLGLAADGTVQVPPIAPHDQAGWYRHSPTPGQTGPSVILGHVTVGEYGDGVFRHLAGLHRGDRIVARLENGTEAVFDVTSVRTVAKADFPTDDVYGDVGRPELRLITCGGTLTDDGYLDNVIVFAALSTPT
ncbi:class F sortase [Streptomyces sp. NPDC088747]|uniref:class F sortase n=1 Tax=Streptomyces sp. NPDC088747 TaxID=3365886 RepID=UPI00381C3019